MAGMGKWIGSTDISMSDPVSVTSMTLVGNCSISQPFSKSPRPGFQGAVLHCQVIILLCFSWFHLWIKTGNSLAGRKRGGGKGVNNRTHLSCCIAVEIDEKVFWNFSKVLEGKAFYEICCASWSVGTMNLNLWDWKKRRSKLWMLVLAVKEQ